jgi:TrmH family RNA methyltransferase
MGKGIPIYGTLLEGDNLFTTELTDNGIIIFGNEGKGINNELLPMITRKITIPSFHSGESHPDSLNVSVAASIIVSEFRRRSLTGQVN